MRSGAQRPDHLGARTNTVMECQKKNHFLSIVQVYYEMINKYQAGWCSSNALHLCLEGVWIRCQQAMLIKVFYGFPQPHPPTNILGYYLNYTMTNSFHILHNSSVSYCGLL